MPKKVTTQSFIQKSKSIHKQKYTYEKVEYINNKTKVTITCSIHGDFIQKPNDHLQGKGCSKCGGKEKLSNVDFVQKAKNVHGEKYDYTLTNYITSKDKVKIICKKHGIFEQKASHHIQGHECYKCSISSNSKSGWTTKEWKKAAENSKNFDSFKVYIIKCWNEEEEFYKIGKTFTTLSKRFEFNIPYNYEIVKIFKGEAEEMSILERKLQKQNIKDNYTPLNKFRGHKECFKNLNYANQIS